MPDIRLKSYDNMTVVDGERAVVGIISTNTVDLQGDVLMAEGCNLTEYNRKKTFLFMHNKASIPVGRCINISRNPDSIVGKFVFLERPPTYPTGQDWLPDTLLWAYQQKAMCGFSVGYKEDKIRDANDRDLDLFGHKCLAVTSHWTLHEVSACAVPVNPDALAVMVSKGINLDKIAEEYTNVIGQGRPVVDLITKSLEPAPRKIVYMYNATPRRSSNLAALAILKAKGRIYE